MQDKWSEVSAQGINAMERELYVREFLNAVTTTDAEILQYFLAPNVRFVGAGTSGVVEGRDSVVEHCARMLRGTSAVTVDINFIAPTQSMVLVEESLRMSYPNGARVTSRGYSTFLFDQSRICEWRQMWGPPAE